MCLAPRYRNGPIAAPLMLSTKVASLRDTPCASAKPVTTKIAASPSTATMSAFQLGRVRPSGRPRSFDRDFIIAMTAVTGIVERLARGEQRFDVFLLGGAI